MTIRFMLGGEVGRIVEEEADKRGLSGATLARTIIGDWVRDDYKKRMRGKKSPQNQGLVATEGIPASELDANKGKTTKEPAAVA